MVLPTDAVMGVEALGVVINGYNDAYGQIYFVHFLHCPVDGGSLRGVGELWQKSKSTRLHVATSGNIWIMSFRWQRGAGVINFTR